MAYQIGTVDNYRQLLKMFATFVTTDAGVASEGGNWALNTGRVSAQAIEYNEHTSFGENGRLEWDKAIAMGADNAFAAESYSEPYLGWKAYSTDLPDAALGFESASAVLPDHYIITAVDWVADKADEHPETWFVEYSDNGTDWTEGDDVSTAGGGTYEDQTTWTAAEERSFDVPTGLGTHVHWRLRFITNNGDSTLLSLGRLRFYNSTPDWISYSYSNEYQFVAPGLTGTEEIYMGVRLVEDPIADYFNFELMGSIGFNVDEGFRSQPFSMFEAIDIYTESYVLLYDQPLKYWLCANGQRAVMVIKVSTVYVSLYIGKFLPYATPSQNPYPLMIAGCTNAEAKRWSDETANNANIVAPDNGSDSGAYLFGSNNVWTYFGGSAHGPRVPATGYGVGIIHNMYRCFTSDSSEFENILQNPDGSYCIIPHILLGLGIGDKGLLGEIEGVFWVTGNGNLSENILTINSQDYLVFQNVFRTQWNDYAVLELK